MKNKIKHFWTDMDFTKKIHKQNCTKKILQTYYCRKLRKKCRVNLCFPQLISWLICHD